MNLIIFHPEAENELNSTIDFYNRKYLDWVWNSLMKLKE